MARGGISPADGIPPGVRPLTVGDPVIIGRYLLLGRLGAGGMGVVYLAQHPQGGFVALKTPHAVHLGDATLRARFAEEVEFSRRVVPFCTAAVLEDGADKDRPYLVSEYIPGPPLSQVIAATGPLTPDLAYGVALGAAAALAAVHGAGLIHRDLKPGNVLLSPDGPRLIDFGIATDVDSEGAHTQAGQVMGSPGWVAPERLTGGRAVPASDVFAWGCVVAYAAGGHHPFGAGEADVVTRRIMVEPPRLTGVPALLLPAVAAALAKDPTERPPASELLAALLAAGGVGAPWDLREAVGAVLAEVWTKVPHPPGGGPGRQAPAGPVALPAARPAGKGNRRRQAHLSQATFAALATVSIAAVTVIAAGGGGTPAGGIADGTPYPRPGGQTALSTARPGHVETVAGASGGPGTVTAVRSLPVVVVTATRTARPADGPTTPQGTYSLPHPPGDLEPEEPGQPDAEPTCTNRRGRPRPCRPTEGPPTPPRPSGSISTEPQWGDGESPSPTPSVSVPVPPTGTPGPMP
ncbi:serine/threonine protein kinase [Spongiactinospora sp. TRM90649]|uniref:protein kinase domain-containing protein n=1 Tax=Spongiactinospora sp. TRM90649 TaxID=3031114 RepID=UPI0023F72BB3|nr:serine/threonine protein kinase [Spongiactinospora sp. TRM90649]MDF5753919.1 protein kinase [Spongiactinospora sp. TRM90649]